MSILMGPGLSIDWSRIQSRVQTSHGSLIEGRRLSRDVPEQWHATQFLPGFPWQCTVSGSSYVLLILFASSGFWTHRKALVSFEVLLKAASSLMLICTCCKRAHIANLGEDVYFANAIYLMSPVASSRSSSLGFWGLQFYSTKTRRHQIYQGTMQIYADYKYSFISKKPRRCLFDRSSLLMSAKAPTSGPLTLVAIAQLHVILAQIAVGVGLWGK